MGIRRFIIVLLLIPLIASGQEPRQIAPAEITSVLHEGDQVRIDTRSRKTLKGKAIKVTAEGVTVQTKDQETYLPLQDIESFKVTRNRGNKRTWLPVILCATAGTASLVAAGATEENKSTYLPIAAAFTVGLGVGGYYLGRLWDRQETSYKLIQSKP